MASRNAKVIFAAIAWSVVLAGIGQSREPLTLPEAIRLAEAHSPNLGALRHDSLAARFDLAAARALRFPTLSANATSFYTDEVQTIELPFNRVELGDNENHSAEIRLALPLYAGGRISSQIGVQSSLAAVRAYNLAAGRIQNAFQARRAYLGAMLASSAVLVAEASLRRVEVLNQDVSNLYAAGMADSVDVLDSQSALERARRALIERQGASENAQSLLARLTGLPRAEIVLADQDPPVPDFEPYENAGAVPETLGRPELPALGARVEAARRTVGLNRSGYLPNLNAFGGYTVGKPGRDIVEKDWNDYWTIGLNLNWEFNLGLRALRGVSSAREGVRSAELARDDLEETLRLAARIAYDNLKQAYQNHAIAQREFRIAERKYALGLERQRAGALSVNRLIELEQDLAAAEQLQRSAVINYYLAENEYLYAIGSSRIYGGF